MNLKRISFVLAGAALVASQALASGGSGGGGGGSATAVNPLPTTPPSPDIFLRESFGPGPAPDYARPQGGNGNLRQVFAGTGLSGYWLEYPGSKSMAWATPDTGPGWHFAYASTNPYEIASPLQPDPFNGIVISAWTDGVVSYPDAIIPFRGAAAKYSVSAELYPGVLTGAYVALGLTSSSALQSNLAAGGQVWLLLAQVAPFDGISGYYELHVGSQTVSSGAVILQGFTPVSLIVDPVAQTVSATLNGADLGTWSARVSPSFIALEGQGWADDVIARTVP